MKLQLSPPHVVLDEPFASRRQPPMEEAPLVDVGVEDPTHAVAGDEDTLTTSNMLQHRWRSSLPSVVKLGHWAGRVPVTRSRQSRRERARGRIEGASGSCGWVRSHPHEARPMGFPNRVARSGDALATVLRDALSWRSEITVQDLIALTERRQDTDMGRAPAADRTRAPNDSFPD